MSLGLRTPGIENAGCWCAGMVPAGPLQVALGPQPRPGRVRIAALREAGRIYEVEGIDARDRRGGDIACFSHGHEV